MSTERRYFCEMQCFQATGYPSAYRTIKDLSFAEITGLHHDLWRHGGQGPLPERWLDFQKIIKEGSTTCEGEVTNEMTDRSSSTLHQNHNINPQPGQ